MPQMLWLPPRRHLGALVGRVPALRRLLSTATRLPDAVAGANALLSTVFLECPEFPAVAALTRRVDAPDDHDGRWLRADPCHLRVETAGVRMLACGGLRIPEDELPMFEAALRPLFDEAGWRFHAATPDRWYVQPDPLHPPIGGGTPEQVLGAYIDDALPPGDGGRVTRRWLNELQMALHDHALNRARRERSLPEINSLWLHGDGVAPNAWSTRVAAVMSRDPLVLGCADVAGIPVRHDLADVTPALLVDARDDVVATVLARSRWLEQSSALDIALESGERFVWRSWHRLRFWRREPT
ncbi:MAG: hypothetical protein KA505_02320 [Xanthomonadales bacterium]|nr:hypothetical protein [Xanthomonadales bacterium]MBP7623633.1 hypothetical protein [Xanthomonadales bacterium]